MSLTNTQRARLGIFMVAGLVLLFVFVSIPIGLKLSERQKRYFATFEGESLSGLEQGAVVKYYGVPIGKVDKVEFNTDNIERVRVQIRIRHDFPVKEGMYIQTGMVGITGLKYVEIMGGTNEAPLLKPDSEIPVKPSFIASITGKADVIIGKIELLLNHVNTFTHPDSLASIREIFNNVAVITNEAKGFVSDIKPNVVDISYSAKSTMVKIDSISSDIKSFTETINRSMDADRLVDILQSVDSAAVSLKSLSENLDMTVRQTREDFAVSMENLRETMENANELMKLLAENPSLILKSDPQKARSAR